MAFTLDRDSAARRLSVSTRTIDRHIKNGIIKTRRIGKKMFLEEDDVEILRSLDPARSEETYEVVTEKNPSTKNMKSSESGIITLSDSQALTEFSRLYDDAKRLVEKKDEIIQDLSYRLGKTETELKSSISMIEYKKATFLLESVKTKNDENRADMSQKIEFLEKEINKRSSAIIALAILFVLVLAFSLVFFFYSRFI